MARSIVTRACLDYRQNQAEAQLNKTWREARFFEWGSGQDLKAIAHDQKKVASSWAPRKRQTLAQNIWQIAAFSLPKGGPVRDGN